MENHPALPARRRMSARKREAITGFAFASPWIIGLLAFTLIPILSSLFLSFTMYDTRTPPLFVGLSNFKTMFTTDSLFWESIGNTLYFVAFSVPLSLATSLLIAVLLNQRIPCMRLFRTFFYLPTVVSIVAVALLWTWILEPTYGPINTFLSWFGIEGPGWLTEESTSKISLVVMGLWSTGGTVIIFLAALQDVPAALHESALIDGAGAVRRFFQITIPIISPTLYFNLIMGIISAFQVFTQALIMTNGGPGKSTYFFSLHIYQKAFADLQFGYACALSWVLFVLIAVTAGLVMAFGGKLVHYTE